MTSQRVVVTGASSGIGAATVALFREKGYEVLGVARRADRLTELARRTGADVFAADLTSDDDVAALAEYVRSNGGAQILINNAGGAFGLASVEESSTEDWLNMYNINVLGTKRVISALLPTLRRSTPAGQTASIVGITSIAGHTAYEGGGGYNAAKFAERALLEVLRLELSGEPIRVIEIAPGMVHTEEFSLVRFGGDQARADSVYAEVPNPLTAEDIAEAIVHAVELPAHVNIDHLTVKPVAQAAPYKVAKGDLNMKR
ncbi:SDR family oxidoreductase [Mycetocola tolaasinivorans]|uniref:SDR family oxidoreductase n=1 Tax=Mycetocola tolaasinivorans TaxID=76635 RepID=A0A3L7A8G3_9MICO|nr:SDR family oxidoreductase [Mycetocola tolaasinivorans]RLP76110.1 SDR family oxidoreductase [Mycetocola tolaasinivorans]